MERRRLKQKSNQDPENKLGIVRVVRVRYKTNNLLGALGGPTTVNDNLLADRVETSSTAF